MADSQSGYAAVNLEVLKKIDLDSIYKRYGMPNDFLVKLNVYDFKVRDVPVNPIYRIGEWSGIKIYRVVFTLYLGQAYLSHGKYDEAMKRFEQALRLNPRSAESIYNLGLISYHKGESDKALEQFKQAFELDNSFFCPFILWELLVWVRENMLKLLSILKNVLL